MSRVFALTPEILGVVSVIYITIYRCIIIEIITLDWWRIIAATTNQPENSSKLVTKAGRVRKQLLEFYIEPRN